MRDKIAEAHLVGDSGLTLMVSESGPEAGIAYGGSTNPNEFGEELGLSGTETVALIERIRDRYLKGRLDNRHPTMPIYSVEVRNISDEGLQMLNLLPPDQMIAALLGVIAAAQDPDTPGDEQEKRAVVKWANDTIALLQRAEWVAYKVMEYWPSG